MKGNSDEKTAIRVLEAKGARDRDDGDFDHGNHPHDDEAMMKMMISGHPLFELLVETRNNCFKVGLGLDLDLEKDEEEEVIGATNNLALTDEPSNVKSNSAFPSTPELDKFMEAYCMALEKLREAMEGPVRDATSFISNMYKQLDDLHETDNEEAI